MCLCNNSDQTCFSDILTPAGPLGRCWNPRLSGSGFNTSLGAQQMLMHRKVCLIPILKLNIKPLTWVMSLQNLFMPCANNKDADQRAHPRSLKSVFVIHFVDSIISIDAIYILNFKTLVSLICWVDRFESYLVANPEDRFSHDEAKMTRPVCKALSI